MLNKLSQNIRYLRKRMGLSQQQLANELKVKRSNIAAYETKNVEPRLGLINDMAVFFQVPLADLITKNVEAQSNPLGQGPVEDLPTPNGRFKDAGFQQYNHEITQMLNGFRIFYEYKQKNAGSDKRDPEVDNFIVFISHMQEYNRRITSILETSGGSQAATEEVYTTAAIATPSSSPSNQ